MAEGNLEIGLKMSLTINEDAEEKIMVTLVGWDEKVFILAKSPFFRSTKITSDDDCVIRYVKDGIAYGFKTRMLSMQYIPETMVFFRYPDEIKSMPFRKSKRVRTNIPARLLKKEEENRFTTVDAKIIDISETGCLVEVGYDSSTSKLERNNQFFINFKIFDRSIELDCSIKNLRQKDNSLHIGSEFINVSEVVKETIASFISMVDSHTAFDS